MVSASSTLSFVLSSWTPSSIPPTSASTSINPTAITGITETLASATSALATATKVGSLLQLSQIIRGAEASLTVISAEQVLATATAAAEQKLAKQQFFDASVNLIALAEDKNSYGGPLSLAGNVIFTVFFGLLILIHAGYMTWAKFWYFGVCLIFGCGLEFAGYLARSLAVNDNSDINLFLCQIICLTIAPAFLMAGVYFLLGKVIVVHGRTHSMLKPVWYGYIFICCDVLSLVIQAIGGGMAAVASINFTNTDNGTHVMVAGIAFQVVSMSLFLFFWFDFLIRAHFRVTPEYKFSVARFFGIFFPTARARQEKQEYLEPHYDEKFRYLRERPYFRFFPIAVTLATLFIYIRCIYRVVELAGGWRGTLITHEKYLFTLDGMMCLLTCLTFVIIHPVAFLGRGVSLPLRAKKSKDTEESGEEYLTNEYDPEAESAGGVSADAEKVEPESSLPKPESSL